MISASTNSCSWHGYSHSPPCLIAARRDRWRSNIRKVYAGVKHLSLCSIFPSSHAYLLLLFILFTLWFTWFWTWYRTYFSDALDSYCGETSLLEFWSVDIVKRIIILTYLECFYPHCYRNGLHTGLAWEWATRLTTCVTRANFGWLIDSLKGSFIFNISHLCLLRSLVQGCKQERECRISSARRFWRLVLLKKFVSSNVHRFDTWGGCCIFVPSFFWCPSGRRKNTVLAVCKVHVWVCSAAFLSPSPYTFHSGGLSYYWQLEEWTSARENMIGLSQQYTCERASYRVGIRKCQIVLFACAYFSFTPNCRVLLMDNRLVARNQIELQNQKSLPLMILTVPLNRN